MTLDEAEAHIGNPVVAIGYRVVKGIVVSVDRAKDRVGVREQRSTHPYDLLPETQW